MYRILLLLLFVCSSIASNSQLYLVHADKSIGKLENGEKIRILSGNVEAYQDTLHMLCDEAVFYEDREEIVFVGNVFLEDGHRTLRADRIRYYTPSRTAVCLGNVRISGANDSLFAQKFIYNFTKRNAEGEKNLFLWDKQNDARIWGDFGTYREQNQHMLIKKNARFESYTEGEPDTLVITAQFMDYFGLKKKTAIARDSVVIKKGTLSAVCDSALYDMKNELVHLKVNPVAWQEGSEMRGSLIDLVLDSLEIQKINISGAAELKSPADSLNQRFNFLRGKTIEVQLTDRKPQKIIARNNASSIYVLWDDSVEQGTNSASSDSIIIFFKAGEMDSIAVIGGSEGIFYPPDYEGEIESDY